MTQTTVFEYPRSASCPGRRALRAQLALTPAEIQPDVGREGRTKRKGGARRGRPFHRHRARDALDRRPHRLPSPSRARATHQHHDPPRRRVPRRLTADESTCPHRPWARSPSRGELALDAYAQIGGIFVLMLAAFGGLMPTSRSPARSSGASKQVNRGLPHTIDLVALTMSAGLDFPGAMRQVTEKTADKRDAIYEELNRILQELELGRTRKQALLAFADRCPTEAVRDFTSSVVQAEEKGNPSPRCSRSRPPCSACGAASPRRRARGAGVPDGAAHAHLRHHHAHHPRALRGQHRVGPRNLGAPCDAHAAARCLPPDGTVQNFPLTDERVVVGTSTKCQVMIDRRSSRRSTSCSRRGPTGAGWPWRVGVATPTLSTTRPSTAAWWPGGSLVVGQVRMVLRQRPRGRQGEEGEEGQGGEGLPVLPGRRRGGDGPRRLDAALRAQQPPAPSRVNTRRHQLFDDLNRPCPQADPSLVASTAEESTRIALSKSERMPFRTQDGVRGRHLLRPGRRVPPRAAANPDAAAEATRRANSLKARLEEEYTCAPLRLERALEQTRYDDALYGDDHRARLCTAGPSPRAQLALERQLTLRIDQAAAAAADRVPDALGVGRRRRGSTSPRGSSSTTRRSPAPASVARRHDRARGPRARLVARPPPRPRHQRRPLRARRGGIARAGGGARWQLALLPRALVRGPGRRASTSTTPSTTARRPARRANHVEPRGRAPNPVARWCGSSRCREDAPGGAALRVRVAPRARRRQLRQGPAQPRVPRALRLAPRAPRRAPRRHRPVERRGAGGGEPAARRPRQTHRASCAGRNRTARPMSLPTRGGRSPRRSPSMTTGPRKTHDFCWLNLATPKANAAGTSSPGSSAGRTARCPAPGGSLILVDGLAAGAMMDLDANVMPPARPRHRRDGAGRRRRGHGREGRRARRPGRPPMTVMENGRMALVTDPCGAMIGLWGPLQTRLRLRRPGPRRPDVVRNAHQRRREGGGLLPGRSSGGRRRPSTRRRG